MLGNERIEFRRRDGKVSWPSRFCLLFSASSIFADMLTSIHLQRYSGTNDTIRIRFENRSGYGILRAGCTNDASR